MLAYQDLNCSCNGRWLDAKLVLSFYLLSCVCHCRELWLVFLVTISVLLRFDTAFMTIFSNHHFICSVVRKICPNIDEKIIHCFWAEALPMQGLPVWAQLSIHQVHHSALWFSECSSWFICSIRHLLLHVWIFVLSWEKNCWHFGGMRFLLQSCELSIELNFFELLLYMAEHHNYMVCIQFSLSTILHNITKLSKYECRVIKGLLWFIIHLKEFL